MAGRWWRGFRIWLVGTEISLAIIALNGDPITATRRLRKGLRDVRDRAARHDHRWAAVAMAGLTDEGRALILIQHAGITRDELWTRFERRWPAVIVVDRGDATPSSRMTVDAAAALARRRRGIEPICAKISLDPPRRDLILGADARHSICFD
jgi:hypothetical protein